MADKARHAFGALENVDSALSSGIIDAFDILFLKDSDGNPHIGWIDKNGEKVILEQEDYAALETLVNELSEKVDTKADTASVEEMIETAVAEAVSVEVVEF